MKHKFSFYLCILSIATVCHLQADAQEGGTPRSSHQGIFAQTMQTKQVFNNALGTSEWKFSGAIGFYQHFDLGAKTQLRIGAALSSYQINETDYSPMFGSDLDTATWQVDVYKSYIDNRVEILQINIPVNVRYKLFGTANHTYIAGGLEGRFVIRDQFTARINESGHILREIDNEPFFESRIPVIAGHLEVGYEFLTGDHKINISAIVKRGLISQFTGRGSAFRNIHRGHALDLGIGVGFIF